MTYGFTKRGRMAALAAGALVLTIAACGGEGDGGGGNSFVAPAPPPPPVTSPGSGLFAVDCNTQTAYVPLNRFDTATGNGQVAVVDLTADPDVKNPIITTVVLSHPDQPTGTAFDNDHKLILVVSGETFGQDGKLDIIDETTNTLVAGSPFSFPAGSQSGFFGQILYNPTTHLAVAATCDSASCDSVGDPLEGFATFDPVAHTFGPIVQANYPETFALNAATNVITDASDSNNGFTSIVDLKAGRTCTLTDANINRDQDGASTDASTNLTIISNEDGTATVVNLHGATATPASGTPCSVNYAGTPPNSVVLSGLPPETAGSAIDATRHQAFLIEDGSPGVTLVQLPSTAKGQLTAGDIPTPAISSIPSTPLGASWSTQGDPYAVSIDVCKNRGYAIDDQFSFLAQVDLATLKSTPAVISTALPAGNCAGTSTTFSCKNGNGVVFFPLPGSGA